MTASSVAAAPPAGRTTGFGRGAPARRALERASLLRGAAVDGAALRARSRVCFCTSSSGLGYAAAYRLAGAAESTVIFLDARAPIAETRRPPEPEGDHGRPSRHRTSARRAPPHRAGSNHSIGAARRPAGELRRATV